jgi:hypothetical protein
MAATSAGRRKVSIVTALILIASAACVLVGGLELFAVTRLRDLERWNGELLDRIEEREGALQEQERRLWELAPVAEVEQRFADAGAVADQRHDEVVAAVLALRSALEECETRLGELGRPEESPIEALRGPIGVLQAALTGQRADLDAIEDRVHELERSYAGLDRRLDELGRAVLEGGLLAAYPREEAPELGEGTARAALGMEPAALRKVLVLLVEECMAAGGLTRAEAEDGDATPLRARPRGLRRGDPNVPAARHPRRRGTRSADPT